MHPHQNQIMFSCPESHTKFYRNLNKQTKSTKYVPLKIHLDFYILIFKMYVYDKLSHDNLLHSTEITMLHSLKLEHGVKYSMQNLGLHPIKHDDQGDGVRRVK